MIVISKCGLFVFFGGGGGEGGGFVSLVSPPPPLPIFCTHDLVEKQDPSQPLLPQLWSRNIHNVNYGVTSLCSSWYT